jgi:hypothetical protein
MTSEHEVLAIEVSRWDTAVEGRRPGRLEDKESVMAERDNQQATPIPEPDPALKRLDRLVGTWSMDGHLMDSDENNISDRNRRVAHVLRYGLQVCARTVHQGSVCMSESVESEIETALSRHGGESLGN